MKRFTNKEQTHHLIELGFPRPCSISDFEEIVDYPGTTVIFDYDYSIGELIEFLGIHMTLPKKIQGELIDELYEACVELKEQGVI